jgi:ribosomal protein L4
MPVADVKNLEGKKVGTIELADDVFGVKVNAHLLHEAVRHHLASKHAGTHKTKDKSEVSSGSRREPAALVLVRFVRLSGATAAQCTVRRRAAIPTRCRRK